MNGRSLIRFATISLAGIILASCTKEAPPESQDPILSLQHLASSDSAGNDPLQRVIAHREIRTTPFPIPYRTGERSIAVDDNNSIRLGDLVDADQVSDGTKGFALFFDSMNGKAHRYVALEDGQSFADVADTIVNALPAYMSGLRGRIMDNVNAWGREVLPRPREFATAPVAIGPNARLEVGLAPETMTTGTPLRMVPNFNQDPPPVPSRVAVTIFVEQNGSRESVYTEEIESPLLKDEEDPSDDHFQWRDISVDLQQYEGQEVSFVFNISAEPAEEDSVDTSSWIWSDPRVLTRAPAPKTNVILISLDTLRADHLGCYGYEKNTSPNIDAFAKSAVLFERCMAPASWTTPSHATVFTGLPSSAHRAGGLMHRRLRPSFTTLAEVFRDEGYLTAAYTEGIAMSGELGFDQGFDTYGDGYGPGLKPGSAEKTFTKGLDWLDRHGDHPFFLYLHTYEIHAPYQAPEPFHSRFAEGVPPGVIPEAGGVAIEKARDAYDAEIAYTDDALGKLFDALQERGLLESSLVVIFSDHGEEFGEHGGITHARTVFQEQLHVPLIVRMPGATPPTGRVSQLVGLGDIFATILNGADVDHPIPSTSHNLIPLMHGQTGAYARDMVTSTLLYRKERKFFVAAQDESRKYIVTSQYATENSPIYGVEVDSIGTMEIPLLRAKESISQSYFDLETDPGELSDDIANSPEGLDEFRDDIVAFFEKLQEEDFVQDTVAEESQPLTQKEQEELEALGYIE